MKHNRLLPVVFLVFGLVFGTLGTATAINTLTDDEQALADLYDSISPSVVSISIDQQRGRVFQQVGSGSGFVIDQAGHIVTNNHVVDGADRIVINFLDGTIVEGELIGTDPDSDIAVLQVNVPPQRLVPAQFGDSSQLVIGQQALAIGSPFGQRWTLTEGIISALERTIPGLAQFRVGGVIQTDAAINPGNSGGPLLNLNGEVIGVNTQILSEVRANSGVGFAVPSDLVRRVATELIEAGTVDYSYLGINGDDITLDYMQFYNLPNNLRGVAITGIENGGPADNGGILNRTNQSVDVIVSINGAPITGFDSLISYLAVNTRPGQTVSMRVLRNGQYIDLDVLLGSRLSR
jgi:S1-C subfamily serine protease